MNIRGIEGVIFDMDGTLIDSEVHTETSVREALARRGIDASDLDCTSFYGITWASVAARLRECFPQLAEAALVDELQDRFHRLVVDGETPLIPGAEAFLRRCCAQVPTAIATSSNRESVEHLVDRLRMADELRVYVAAEDYARSKPDPECYLLTSGRLGLATSSCLVFEDSIAGLQAAKGAGMSAIAITHRSPDRARASAIADLAIRDYTVLEPGFLDRVRRSRQDD